MLSQFSTQAWPLAQEMEARRWRGGGVGVGPQMRRAPAGGKGAPPGPFLQLCCFSLCHYRKTTRRSSTFPQPFQKEKRVDGAAVGRPTLLLYFPPFLQLPRSSHFFPATTFRSLGPGCPGCTLHVLKSIVYSPSVLSWDPSPGHLPSEAISVPLPLSAPSPHV